MAVGKKGWNRQCMMSLYKKEASYDAAVTMDGTNACSMTGFELDTDWPDEMRTDKEEITNKEFGSTQEILAQRTHFTYREPKCKPNTAIGLMALALGNITSTQDGAYTGYRHKITPVAVGTALPSINAEELFAGIQYLYKGVKCNTVKLSGEAGGYLALEANLIGSGTRSTSATGFVASVSESWMKMSQCKVWLEDGASISIDGTLTQEAENISSGSPTALGPRFKSFEFLWDNDMSGPDQLQEGFGGGGVYQDIDYGRRKQDLKFSLIFNDNAELNYFINQNPLAIEFDLKGAIIDASGTLYYGCQLVIPRFMLKKAPLPKAGVNDTVVAEFECDIQEDGTNAVVIFEGYNAKIAYLAA